MAAHCDWSGVEETYKLNTYRWYWGQNMETGEKQEFLSTRNKPPTSCSNAKGEKSFAAISDKSVKNQEKKKLNLLDITNNVIEEERLRADSEPVQRTDWKSLFFSFFGKDYSS